MGKFRRGVGVTSYLGDINRLRAAAQKAEERLSRLEERLHAIAPDAPLAPGEATLASSAAPGTEEAR